MDNLMRGWAVLTQHWHGHGWPAWIAIFTAIWIPIGVAMMRKKDRKPDRRDFRPIPRRQIPGSEKDYRRDRSLD